MQKWHWSSRSTWLDIIRLANDQYEFLSENSRSCLVLSCLWIKHFDFNMLIQPKHIEFELNIICRWIVYFMNLTFYLFEKIKKVIFDIDDDVWIHGWIDDGQSLLMASISSYSFWPRFPAGMQFYQLVMHMYCHARSTLMIEEIIVTIVRMHILYSSMQEKKPNEYSFCVDHWFIPKINISIA